VEKCFGEYELGIRRLEIRIWNLVFGISLGIGN